jgi:type I restriction enzyme R subunit
MPLSQSTVETAALAWFEALGYSIYNGLEIAHDGLVAERKGYENIVLGAALQFAPEPLNPGLPPAYATPMELKT